MSIAVPSPDRLFQVARAFQLGLSLERAHELTRIDTWEILQAAQLLGISRQNLQNILSRGKV